MKNDILRIFKQYKYNLAFGIYFLLMFIVVNDNSNFELFIKGVILFGFLLLLNKKEITKIFFIFYFLFFISYFLFFISYFLVNDESSANLANFLFILSYLLFLPVYILASVIIIFKNLSIFLKNNLVLFSSIVISVLLPYFGYERGLDTMNYTRVDIFLFLLMVIQLLVIVYFNKIKIQK